MVTAAQKKKLGLKRICANCGTRYYDFEKRPIICPSCETEFTGEYKVKSRRGRAAADTKEEVKKVAVKEVIEPNEDEILEEEEEVLEVVSLEDAEIEESKDPVDEEKAPIDLVAEADLDDIPEFDDDLEVPVADDDEELLEEDED